MKLSYLLSQMQLDIIERQIGFDEMSADACVLPEEENPSGQNIYVVQPDRLQKVLDRSKGEPLCVFCAGEMPAGLEVPVNNSVVCFHNNQAEIFVAAQRALQKLRPQLLTFGDHGSLFEQAIEGKLRGDENTKELLYNLGLRQSSRFWVAIISFVGSLESVPWEKVKKQFGHCLQTDSVYTYKNELIALCSMEENETIPKLPGEELQLKLKQWNAYAAISYSAKRPSALRALYFQAKAAMRFGISMKKQEGNRIFSYEEYATFQIVDYCASAYKKDLEQDDLVYLCHPALGKVLRYDRENGTNLAVVLRKYLENNCNMSQTAKDLFIHRNTMLGRLDKLEELLGVSIKETGVRMQLQFSFYVADYSERYLHQYLF